MSSKEFTKLWQALDYVMSVTCKVVVYIYSNQEEIVKRMEEEGIERVAELAIEDLNTTIIYNGKQLSLNDRDGVCWIAGIGLRWLYSRFEYDEDELDAQNFDGWYIGYLARWYTNGYLNALTNH